MVRWALRKSNRVEQCVLWNAKKKWKWGICSGGIFSNSVSEDMRGQFFPTCSWWAPHGQACQRRSCRSPCRRGWTIGIAWTDVYIEYSVCCVLTWSCSSPCGHQGPWPWSSWHRLSWRPILKIERDEYHVFGHARYLNFVEALDLNRPPITNIVKMRRKVEHYDGIYP